MQKSANDFPDLTGFVFKFNSSFWKVTGLPHRSFGDSFSYPVIVCSSRGKEFRKTNGIDTKHVLTKWREAGEPMINNTVGLKADIDAGIEDGVRKRRIQHLRDTIASAQRELAELGAL